MKKIILLFILTLTFFVICGVLFIHIPLTEITQLKTPPKTGLSVDHIGVIVMENKSLSDIVNNKNAPYINSLIKQYGLVKNYSALAHPSLPNYLALIGGDTFNITTDCENCFISAKNLIDQIEPQNITWRAYMESMPSPCLVGNSGLYAQKHNPFIYFDDIRNNPKRCSKIVPLQVLSKDLENKSSTPNFIWITPNLCSDMHDCSISEGDKWLSRQIPLLLKSDAFSKQNSLLILTWDEGNSQNNQVPAILIGNGINSNPKSNNLYSHYSLLHTIESLWNLQPLTPNVSTSAILSEFPKK